MPYHKTIYRWLYEGNVKLLKKKGKTKKSSNFPAFSISTHTCPLQIWYFAYQKQEFYAKWNKNDKYIHIKHSTRTWYPSIGYLHHKTPHCIDMQLLNHLQENATFFHFFTLILGQIHKNSPSPPTPRQYIQIIFYWLLD